MQYTVYDINKSTNTKIEKFLPGRKFISIYLVQKRRKYLGNKRHLWIQFHNENGELEARPFQKKLCVSLSDILNKDAICFQEERQFWESQTSGKWSVRYSKDPAEHFQIKRE